MIEAEQSSLFTLNSANDAFPHDGCVFRRVAIIPLFPQRIQFFPLSFADLEDRLVSVRFRCRLLRASGGSAH